MDDGMRPVVGIVPRTLEILLVEHDAGDAWRVEQALQTSGADYCLQVLPTGEQALTRLRESGEHSAQRWPDLILVDLHLPDASANRLLAEIHCHDQLRKIPVVALAAPLSDDASLEAFDLEAWLCIRKTAELPVFADRLQRAMRCCLGNFPLHIGANDPAGQSRVAEALILKHRPDRPRRRDEQPTTDRQVWQPSRRDSSFWRRRSA